MPPRRSSRVPVANRNISSNGGLIPAAELLMNPLHGFFSEKNRGEKPIVPSKYSTVATDQRIKERVERKMNKKRVQDKKLATTTSRKEDGENAKRMTATTSSREDDVDVRILTATTSSEEDGEDVKKMTATTSSKEDDEDGNILTATISSEEDVEDVKKMTSSTGGGVKPNEKSRWWWPFDLFN